MTTNETISAQVQQATDFWKKLMGDQLSMLEQGSKLVKASFEHATELNGELQRMGLEATRKMTQLIVGKA